MADPAQAAARIAQGYAFSGAALELGAVVTADGTAHPDSRIRIPLSMLNRHGLVAGATGTGKTKTLQGIAEQLSANGVPVFLADIKGDLSGVSQPGQPNDKIAKRAAETGDDWRPQACPTEFLAIGGIRAGLPLLDLKDLRAVIRYLTSEEGRADLEGIGGLSRATAGVILRELANLEAQGADEFFGEPEFDTADLLRTGPDGAGIVSCVELADLTARPELFSTFLMWLLADLFHDLPEVGDVDAPKLVFFFDEAHLLFDGASKAFRNAVVQTVRLIRSKGVGVF